MKFKTQMASELSIFIHRVFPSCYSSSLQSSSWRYLTSWAADAKGLVKVFYQLHTTAHISPMYTMLAEPRMLLNASATLLTSTDTTHCTVNKIWCFFVIWGHLLGEDMIVLGLHIHSTMLNYGHPTHSSGRFLFPCSKTLFQTIVFIK